jgi:hypothetical protein
MTKTKRTVSPFKIVASTNDPAFHAISAHRRAAKIFMGAVREVCEWDASANDEITEAPRNAMFAAGCALAKTQPTTMPGAIAMLQYLATLFDTNGIDSSVMPETVDDEAWPRAVFRTLAAALVAGLPS